MKHMEHDDEQTKVKTMVLKHRRKGETRTVVKKLGPSSPGDAEFIQDPREAIRHGHGIAINVGERPKAH